MIHKPRALDISDKRRYKFNYSNQGIPPLYYNSKTPVFRGWEVCKILIQDLSQPSHFNWSPKVCHDICQLPSQTWERGEGEGYISGYISNDNAKQSFAFW